MAQVRVVQPAAPQQAASEVSVRRLARGRELSRINHNGIKNPADQSETVQSGDVTKTDSVYVRDAEAIFGILGEIAESIGNSKSLNARSVLQNTLTIALTIFSATFAVSALISSMHGFDKLFSS